MYRFNFTIRVLAYGYFLILFFAVIGVRLFGLLNFSVPHGYNLNLFANVSDFGVNLSGHSLLSRFDWWFNVILFIGYPTAFSVLVSNVKLYKVWVMAVFSSFCIEILQYLLDLGTADINDLIANSLGALIGCFFTFLLNRLFLSRY